MSKFEQICTLLEKKVAAGEITQENADALVESAKIKYAVEESTAGPDETEGEGTATEEAVTLADVMETIKEYLADAKKKGEALEELEDELDNVEDEIKDGEKKDSDDADKKEGEASEEPAEDEAATEEATMEAVKEEVNALRLAVYEAEAAGQISKEDKTTFLEMLTIENYFEA